ncbi:uncharacterized protein LOC135466918 [Liolophura sinensis]|uniref:uncharacterized protein LOC135466918 n=1 Tax=Liolophura sinensis TaxID=3198878 RepID=UPI003158536B
MASPRKKVERVWEFDVSDPKLHPNGFTIYKVTCKVFPVTVQENLTEVVIWKRYNDFKLLYKTLSSLHKCLHRRDEFPEFAKPKVFGRFDESVIEERRKSALDLLNFVGRQYHLYRSPAFVDFFKGGERVQHQKAEQVGKILRPVRLNLKQSTSSVTEEPTNNVTNEEDEAELKTPQNMENGEGLANELTVSNELGVAAETLEAGDELSQTLWNLPQVPDNMSLNSFDGDDDPDLTDVESALSTPLPEADISFFDPLKSDAISPSPDPDTPSELTHSNSWLLSAFKTCADIETNEETPTEQKPVISEEEGDTGITFEVSGPTESTSTPKGGSDINTDSGTEAVPPDASVKALDKADFSEFDPLKSRSHSKVDCGKGDLDLSSRSPSISSCGTPERKASQNSSTSSTPSPKKVVRATAAGSPRRGTPTPEGVADIDLGGQYDYIYIAAHQISRAQESEVAGNYEMAHAYYMSGVGILLQGVQGDTNKARREAVKRKTAKYLMRVEDLGKRYMTNESLMSPDIEIDPSLAYLKGPPSELKNFKVLGTVGKVLLVLDRSTDSTYVIKTLHKAVVTPVPKRPNIVPTSCPYMVQFYKFYETDNAVYMLLQYASGGKLWNYIGAYLQYNHGSGMKGNVNICEGEGKGNIYRGQKFHTDEAASEDRNTNGNKNSASAADVNGGSVIDICDNVTYLCERDGKMCDIASPLREAGNMADIVTVCDKDGTIDGGITAVCDGISGKLGAGKTIRSLSPDICSSAYVELFSKETPAAQGDHEQGLLTEIGVKFVSSKDSAGPEAELTTNQTLPSTTNGSDQSDLRNCSLTSDDMSHINTGISHNTSTFSDKIPAGERFEETLQGSKRSLENFSIGSFEEGDSFHRQDSHTSDHIHSIPEESDVFSTEDALTAPAEEQSDTAQKLLSSSYPDALIDEIDTESIVKSTKELLKSVDRNLQDDRTSFNTVPNLEGSEASINNSSLLANIASNPSSCELSIYDLNKSKENDNLSFSELPTSSETVSLDNAVEVGITALLHDTSTPKQIPPTAKTEAPSYVANHMVQPSPRDRQRSASGTRKGTNIIRMNSKEPCRSASFECDLKSPSKSRTRTISAVFEQLDTASALNHDVVKIPENCIKQWAAEIVVCLNSLHSMGIVCRDLNPDNILLGDRGHVLLTYFSQWSNTEERVEEECVEQLYVAPEVRGITGYSEVCDWWSLGALLYELLVGRSLLSGHPGGVTSHTQLFLPSHLSAEATALLEELLRHNPRERLGAGITGVEEIKSHPFFSDIDWASLTG